MRLNELQAKPADVDTLRTAISTRDDDSKKYNLGAGSAGDNTVYYELDNIMRRHGFESIGVGAKGSVFAKQGYPYVLKVFGDDSAYLDWLNFCRQHQDNPYVPKIKGKPIHITEGFYAIRLERLLKGNNAFGVSQALAALADNYEAIFEQGEPLFKLFNGRRSDFYYHIKQHFPNYMEDANLKEVLKGINDLKQRGHRLDIHNDNIMFRGFASPQPVVIDALRGR